MIAEQNGQNNPAELSVPVFSDKCHSFETLLENICERLQDTRQQGSLKRIRKMEESLEELEKELDELVFSINQMTVNAAGNSLQGAPFDELIAVQTDRDLG